MSPRIVMIAALADNRVIGADGDIPWHLSEDLQHFRRMTEGNVVIMGRKTFDSIGRPLPRRTTIVVTRQPDWEHDGVYVAPNVPDAISMARVFDGDVLIAGGGEIYREALPLATEQVLTQVHLSPEGDAFYPEFDESSWVEVRREHHLGPEGGPSYERVWWERVFIG